jgi:hypothetical protein
MEIDICKEISDIEDFQWNYFDENPRASEDQRSEAVEDRIARLLDVRY